VHATFGQRFHGSDELANTVIDGTATAAEREHAERVIGRVEEFVRAAHRDGRKVLVIDDGGLLARGYGSADRGELRVDAAIELTVSGLKRIRAGAPPDIPVLNMARSELKIHLGYQEIADSCVRRIRTLLPAEPLAGRRVLVLGHGELGSRIAPRLRDAGCRVAVVDTDVLALIDAAQHGFETYRSVREAVAATRPFLVVSGTGEVSLHADDFAVLPDGVFLAGFATKDFSLLAGGALGGHAVPIPGVGVRHELPTGVVTMLGDGRSLNLFGTKGIPPRGYDAYRAGTILAAKELARGGHLLPAGVHTAVVDDLMRREGLYEAYYDTYCRD
jgi:adenosylhomocysteinase